MALTWYCFAVGSNVDMIDDILFNIENNEVMITEKNQKASVIVEEDSVKIVCSSENKYNIDSQIFDVYHGIYLVDKVIELVKNEDEVLWNEVTVERNGRGVKNQKVLIAPETGKLPLDESLLIGQTIFP